MSRAVVLGGGGPVGIAWESGLVAGLAQQGIDLGAADRIVGTSAGSVVGARLALRHEITPPEAPAARERSSDAGAAGRGDSMATRMAGLMEAMTSAAAHRGTPEEARAILGRFALEQRTAPEESFVGWFGDLAGEPWPSSYGCTAVNARTGEFVLWDAAAGVDLQRAVASSCSVPGVFPPITIGADRYIDGGMRSPLNADVVAGAEVVVAISVVPTTAPGAVRPGELDALRDTGGALEVVDGDAALLELTDGGMRLMDPALGPAAYELGLALAQHVAERVDATWNH